VVVALLLPVLALTIGGAIDVVHAEAVRSDLRSVLDSATLAATNESCHKMM
jgi:Flp pilus assembly protein TadG